MKSDGIWPAGGVIAVNDPSDVVCKMKPEESPWIRRGAKMGLTTSTGSPFSFSDPPSVAWPMPIEYLESRSRELRALSDEDLTRLGEIFLAEWERREADGEG